MRKRSLSYNVFENEERQHSHNIDRNKEEKACTKSNPKQARENCHATLPKSKKMVIKFHKICPKMRKNNCSHKLAQNEEENTF